MPSREDLREEFTQFRASLREECATKDDLSALPTRQDLAAFREESAAANADLRRCMDVLYEDLKGMMQTAIEILTAHLDHAA